MDKIREIKFRAWDKELNQFHWIELSSGEIWIDKEWKPLQQYTGLKDKNGKEIYEGDIVECKAVGKEYRLWEIKWSDSMGFYFSHPGTNFIEVIGNIYENPEFYQPWEEPNG